MENKALPKIKLRAVKEPQKEKAPKNTYLLTMRFPITALDDVEARERAWKHMKFHNFVKLDAKLQRVRDKKAPEKVNL